MATTRKTKPQITTFAQAVQASLAAEDESAETADDSTEE